MTEGQTVRLKIDEGQFRPFIVVRNISPTEVRGLLILDPETDSLYQFCRKELYTQPTREHWWHLCTAKRGSAIGEWSLLNAMQQPPPKQIPLTIRGKGGK
jgi:hypothetical protein